MSDFWEAAFTQRGRMWGEGPSPFAVEASQAFQGWGVGSVLMPAFGYGRNAAPFLALGMAVTGVEIAATAVAWARERLGSAVEVHHASVLAMPLGDRQFEAVFCHGLVYLLEAEERASFMAACWAHLKPGGHLVFTLVSKSAPMHGQGPRLGPDRYERAPGLGMSFFDADSIAREFGPFGLVGQEEQVEAGPHGSGLPFYVVRCQKPS